MDASGKSGLGAATSNRQLDAPLHRCRFKPLGLSSQGSRCSIGAHVDEFVATLRRTHLCA